MEKLGKTLSIVAFVLVLLTSPALNYSALLILVLFAGWAIISKADTKVQLSSLEALFLALGNGIVRFVLNGIYDIIYQIIDWADGKYNTIYEIFKYVNFAVTLGVIALAILAILNLKNNKASETYVVSTPAKKALGLFVPAPQPVYYQQPVAQQQPAQGGLWVCPNCGRQNDSLFCQGCGQKKA